MEFGEKRRKTEFAVDKQEFSQFKSMTVDSRPSNRTNVTSRTKHVAAPTLWSKGFETDECLSILSPEL